MIVEQEAKVVQPMERGSMEPAADAGPGGWFQCRVIWTGPASDIDTVGIHLQEVTNQFDHWFKAHPAMQQEALATALTAIATGKIVMAYVTTTDIYGTIERLYLKAYATP